jgi:hypothetical protein
MGNLSARGISVPGSFDHAKPACEYARIALAGIRLFKATAALFAPITLARRLGADPEANPTALYVLRMFGVRTAPIGPQQLPRDGSAPTPCALHLIHALDAIAAVSAGTRRRLPQRAATTAALILTLNTVLAVIAQTRDMEGVTVDESTS